MEKHAPILFLKKYVYFVGNIHPVSYETLQTYVEQTQIAPRLRTIVYGS